jgi:hydroxymethylbilane synthase
MQRMRKLKLGILKTRIMQLTAEGLAEQIDEAFPEINVKIVPIETKLSTASDDPEKISLELVKALLEKKIDLAVHLLKEIPVALPARIELKSVTERITPFDAFVSCGDYTFFDEIPEGANVGVSHIRQQEQLGLYRPDLRFIELQGSVDSRLQQMDSRNLGGIVLSAASLERLGQQGRVSEMIMGDILLPGPGQGCLGILGLRATRKWKELLEHLGDATSRLETTAERAFLAQIADSAEVPLAVLAAVDSSEIIIEGFLADGDTHRSVRDSVRGPSQFAEELGIKLALELSLRLGQDGLVGLGDS